MKGDAANILPPHVATALLAVLRAIPPRGSIGGWPAIDCADQIVPTANKL
jgi:hypothetical protein